VCSYLLESKLRIRDEELQAAVSWLRKLAGDSMHVGYHGCVRDTAIGLGARRDRGLRVRLFAPLVVITECLNPNGYYILLMGTIYM